MANVPASLNFPQFDCQSTDGVSVRWSKYISRYKNMMTGYNITANEQKLALLLHFGGEDLHDLYDSFTTESKTPVAEADPAENVFDKGVNCFTVYFTPKQNTEYQRYEFRHTLQEESENLDKYCTRLRILAATCDFDGVNREIKSQVISGCVSQKLRRKGLSETTWTLDDLLKHGRAFELSELHARDMEKGGKSESVSTVKYKSKVQSNYSPSTSQSSGKKCWNCNGTWPHKGDKCPASGKKCNNCGSDNHFAGSQHCPAVGKQCTVCKKYNHFAKVCRGKKGKWDGKKKFVKVVAEQSNSDSDCEYVYKLSQSNIDPPVFTVKINGMKYNLLADSGASVNILCVEDYEKLKAKPKLQPQTKKVFSYNSKQPLDVLGKFDANVQYKNKQCDTRFIVVDSNNSLLSWQTSKLLGLLCHVNQISKTFDDKIAKLKTDYEDIFTGLGKLKGVKVKLHIDEDVPPVAQTHRRPAFHVRKQVEEQLKTDEDNDVIESPVGPTPWVSPIVVIPKKTPGKVRVCVDMRAANKAIKRERHSSPTLTELVNILNGSVVYSKIDLNQAYNQLEIAEESRYITTFATHVGLKRYKRLTFGINSAAEVFQEEIRKALSGLAGVLNISDDILVYGANDEDHFQHLSALFQRIRDKGLTLNPAKCELNKSSIDFYGHRFSSSGVSPDPAKIASILEMPAPKDQSEVRSLLGMLNYCGQRFIKDYATLTYELRLLTKKGVPWLWTDKHDLALRKLKEVLTTAPCLSYFDPKLESHVYVDASPVGISAILMQKEGDSLHCVHYASRALTDTEQRYSQIEREALAVVWGCEYLNMYLYGASFKIFTDHKPLLALLGSVKSQLPTRIQSWALRLQPYDFELVYKPGSSNPADYLSRHVRDKLLHSKEEEFAESYVSYISSTSVPKSMSLEDIKLATQNDPTLRAVIHAIISGNWHNQRNSPGVDCVVYNKCDLIKHELTVTSDHCLLLKGNRIVIPEKLQRSVLDLAHSGHQGIVKTKALVREKVWFVGIDKMVENIVKNCFTCQMSTNTTAREPLKMSPLPLGPWCEVSMDFAHLSNGKYLFVLVDEYSRFPIVEIVDSTSAKCVIPKLDSVLCYRGIPDVIKSDNGPPFNSDEMRKYAKSTGFKHRKITPLWPRANAETERFMKTVKKVINSSIAQGLSWKQEMNKFLLAYRATPHCSTGVPPATLYFGNSIKTRIPEIRQPCDDSVLRSRDEAAKAKMKRYADSKAYVKPSDIEIGDSVLVKTNSLKKSVPYDPKPLSVVSKKGSMITAQRGSKKVVRNSSFFKKSPVVPTVVDESESDSEDDVSSSSVDISNSSDNIGKHINSSPDVQVRVSPEPVRRVLPTRAHKAPDRFKDYIM